MTHSRMPNESIPPLSEQQVLDYLARHPDFLKKHPELLGVLTPPQRALGDGVVDFQHYQLKNLQKNASSLKTRYEGLVDFCRDNLSVQSQVHEAVLRLIRACSLEQLLEVLTIDMVSLFDLDVVRLAMESEAAEFPQSYYTEHNCSGIVFIPAGTSGALFDGKRAVLVADAEATPLPGFDLIFADCPGLIRSYAFLMLELESLPYHVLLAFGVRYPERFHPGQGLELLHFLAHIIAIRLDTFLGELSV